jgi:hypothetical protein
MLIKIAKSKGKKILEDRIKGNHSYSKTRTLTWNSSCQPRLLNLSVLEKIYIGRNHHRWTGAREEPRASSGKPGYQKE